MFEYCGADLEAAAFVERNGGIDVINSANNSREVSPTSAGRCGGTNGPCSPAEQVGVVDGIGNNNKQLLHQGVEHNDQVSFRLPNNLKNPIDEQAERHQEVLGFGTGSTLECTAPARLLTDLESVWFSTPEPVQGKNGSGFIHFRMCTKADIKTVEQHEKKSSTSISSCSSSSSSGKNIINHNKDQEQQGHQKKQPSQKSNKRRAEQDRGVILNMMEMVGNDEDDDMLDAGEDGGALLDVFSTSGAQAQGPPGSDARTAMRMKEKSTTTSQGLGVEPATKKQKKEVVCLPQPVYKFLLSRKILHAKSNVEHPYRSCIDGATILPGGKQVVTADGNANKQGVTSTSRTASAEVVVDQSKPQDEDMQSELAASTDEKREELVTPKADHDTGSMNVVPNSTNQRPQSLVAGSDPDMKISPWDVYLKRNMLSQAGVRLVHPLLWNVNNAFFIMTLTEHQQGYFVNRAALAKDVSKVLKVDVHSLDKAPGVQVAHFFENALPRGVATPFFQKDRSDREKDPFVGYSVDAVGNVSFKKTRHFSRTGAGNSFCAISGAGNSSLSKGGGGQGKGKGDGETGQHSNRNISTNAKGGFVLQQEPTKTPAFVGPRLVRGGTIADSSTPLPRSAAKGAAARVGSLSASSSNDGKTSSSSSTAACSSAASATANAASSATSSSSLPAHISNDEKEATFSSSSTTSTTQTSQQQNKSSTTSKNHLQKRADRDVKVYSVITGEELPPLWRDQSACDGFHIFAADFLSNPSVKVYFDLGLTAVHVWSKALRRVDNVHYVAASSGSTAGGNKKTCILSLPVDECAPFDSVREVGPDGGLMWRRMLPEPVVKSKAKQVDKRQAVDTTTPSFSARTAANVSGGVGSSGGGRTETSTAKSDHLTELMKFTLPGEQGHMPLQTPASSMTTTPDFGVRRKSQQEVADVDMGEEGDAFNAAFDSVGPLGGA
ncbi:unnamed protein product [Amoebophrya sp. A25]|nr:unnamed protein product [Amoebophrya sp. A25]|eukprot:GSA25T00012687001.1